MNKNYKYILIIIFLFVVLILSLWFSYNNYNENIDGLNYLTDLAEVKCHDLKNDHIGCEVDRVYMNGTKINHTYLMK
jgi:hypothetical protein